MISETDCDEGPREMGERTIETQLPVPCYDDQPQKDKETISTISLPSPKAGTPKSTNHSIASPNNQPLQTLKAQKDFRDKDIFFAIKWTCGILTVAASIVFGIWAPLSYEATISDNDTDDAIASVLSNAKDLASTANIIASNALDTASAQHEVVGSLYSTIGLMGQLAVMEFCYGQQSLSVCSSYLQEADGSLGSLIDRLGGHGTVALTTGTVSVTSSVSPTVDPENRGAGPVPHAAATSAPAAPPAAPAASNPSAAASSEPRLASGATPTSNLASATATLVPTPQGPAAATSQSAAKVPRLPVDAVLGIIFGVIGIGGAVLGFVVWRIRRRRMVLLGE